MLFSVLRVFKTICLLFCFGQGTLFPCRGILYGCPNTPACVGAGSARPNIMQTSDFYFLARNSRTSLTSRLLFIRTESRGICVCSDIRALNSSDKARLVPTVGCLKMQKYSFLFPSSLMFPLSSNIKRLKISSFSF